MARRERPVRSWTGLLQGGVCAALTVLVAVMPPRPAEASTRSDDAVARPAEDAITRAADDAIARPAVAATRAATDPRPDRWILHELPPPGPFALRVDGLAPTGDALALRRFSSAGAWGRQGQLLVGASALLVGLGTRNAVSQVDRDRWGRVRDHVVDFVSARGKQLHFFASSSLALSVTTITGDVRWGVLTSLVVGLAKEVVWDHLLDRGAPSAGDMLANAIGVGFACLVTYLGDRWSDP
jgi:hypothetical protein